MRKTLQYFKKLNSKYRGITLSDNYPLPLSAGFFDIFVQPPKHMGE
jgi:hypothetical protein